MDYDHRILLKDILLPKGLLFTRVVNGNNEILALKEPDFFSVEEDHVTFYKMRLKEVE